MKRRDFFRNGSLAVVGTSTLSGLVPTRQDRESGRKGETAKNIIFLVSDGMSVGTLNMADMLLQRKDGKSSNWLSMYNRLPVRRALMDTSSASSLVTDSAAASSAWGGGKKIPNGSLNTNADGSVNTPIWQKMKAAGKAAGCVTTVPITHATPAGFCVYNKKRGNQEEVALQYLEAQYDVMMGGGLEYFDPSLRSDKMDVFAAYKNKGYAVVQSKSDMLSAPVDKPLLGVFHEDGLPYSVDHNSDESLVKKIPSLAQMTKKAIENLSRNPKGFVLQVEGGKVDWAAHGNDISALLYDQIAFDEAVGVALDFAEKDGNTLVIVTTDHGNANPGLFYGKKANENFDHLLKFKHSNAWLLNSLNKNTSTSELIQKAEWAQGMVLTTEQAQQILANYEKLDETGIYNPRHLPFKQLANIQIDFTSVGWGSMDHSGDYVELAMVGPGSTLLKPFVQNVDLHYLMLEAVGVKAS